MYHSTRGIEKVTSSQAIIKGLANDGGLYVKDDIKVYCLDELKEMSKLSYQDLAIEILKNYLSDFEDEKIKEIVDKAYDEKFDTLNIVEMKKMKGTDEVSFLELFHGPTLAFKDVALSILPLLMKESKRINNQENKTIILTATSGDTGSAALKGFSYDLDTYMVVLYPTNGVSAIQERQMLSLANDRLKVIAIEGNFDDAQKLVKKVFNDPLRFEYSKNIPLSSANSINIGRLIPQIVYYFYGYFRLISSDMLGEKINFVVPTGNFGNILAGFLAKKMGLPINKLICASNDNKVLTDFFNNKEYNKNRKFIKTSSPSMDILVSSNLERLLYYSSFDVNKVKELMNELDKSGVYTVSEDFLETLGQFKAYSATEAEVSEAINDVYQSYDYLIDTHTAVGYCAYQKYLADSKDKTKTVVVSTAHPYKFPKSIAKAIGIGDYADDFDAIKAIKEKTRIEEPEMIKKISASYPKTIWKLDESYENLKKLLMELNNE